MKIKELEFVEFIAEDDIKRKTQSLAAEINGYYEGKNPVFLPVLNGSFMFAADLLKYVTLSCKVSFVKVSSYEGVSSTGQFRTLIGLEESLYNQDVVIIEDIVDTGLTLRKIVDELKGLGAKSVEVVSLLRKKPAREKDIGVQFVGFDIDNEFVLGYGLDYDGLGRNYRQIFQAKKK
ncbi:MAG TPA: hypoxanthine phosphoribosyltransferase [Chryseosolibacter sp.]